MEHSKNNEEIIPINFLIEKQKTVLLFIQILSCYFFLEFFFGLVGEVSAMQVNESIKIAFQEFHVSLLTTVLSIPFIVKSFKKDMSNYTEKELKLKPVSAFVVLLITIFALPLLSEFLIRLL